MVRQRLRTPITYYGGKQQMLQHLLPIIPDHKIYTESFAGGAALYWAKEPSKVEVLNDIDGEIVNFYRQVKTNFESLNRLIQSTLHSRQLHNDAKVIYANPHLFTEVERAWAFWILTNQGFSGTIGSWGYCKGISVPRKNETKKLEFNADLVKRLEKTQIECYDAVKVILSRDTEDTFHYVDPPYINTNQGHYEGYTESHFRELLDTLSEVKGKFILSNYPSDILDEYIKKNGWTTYRFSKQLSASTYKSKKKIEVVTLNYSTGEAE